MKILSGLLWVLLLAGCGNADKPEASLPPAERYTVTVTPYTVDCVGVALMQCMVVDDELFYDHIAGFEFEPGYA